MTRCVRIPASVAARTRYAGILPALLAALAGPGHATAVGPANGGQPAAGESANTGVPFELDAHRVFIPVQVGGAPPLRLFLDTGLTYPGVFLFHEERIRDLDLPELADVLVPGAGDEEPSRAVMADSVDLRIGDTVLPRQWVVISRSERTQGFPSEGIIGGTLFTDFAVEVDYAAMRFTLHDPGAHSPDSSWTILPIEIIRGIPWLDAFVVTSEGAPPQPVRAYIDLADDFPVTLLTAPDRRFTMPPDGEDELLGTGLSGDIRGKTGEITALHVGPFRLAHVRTAFAPAGTRSKQDGADIILGNGLLERFHVTFDYRGGRLWLRPREGFAVRRQ